MDEVVGTVHRKDRKGILLDLGLFGVGSRLVPFDSGSGSSGFVGCSPPPPKA